MTKAYPRLQRTPEGGGAEGEEVDVVGVEKRVEVEDADVGDDG